MLFTLAARVVAITTIEYLVCGGSKMVEQRQQLEIHSG
jgi:hypothetical protein